MADLNWSVLADTELRDLAIQSVGQFDSDNLRSIKASQLSGLRRIATAAPLQVKDFAVHQSRRSEGKPAVQAFWDHIRAHCDDATARAGTLARLGEQHLPADKRVPEFAADQKKTTEDRQLLKQKKKERRTWLDSVWSPRAVPMFFDYFCVEFRSRQALASRD